MRCYIVEGKQICKVNVATGSTFSLFQRSRALRVSKFGRCRRILLSADKGRQPGRMPTYEFNIIIKLCQQLPVVSQSMLD